MKKILSLLTAITLTASGASPVISCKNQSVQDQNSFNNLCSNIENRKIMININNLNQRKVFFYKDEVKKHLDWGFISSTWKNADFNFIKPDDKISIMSKNIKINLKWQKYSKVINLKIGFNSKNVLINDNLAINNNILFIKEYNYKIYIATNSGVFISSDGKIFTRISAIPNSSDGYTIQQIGTKIYIGTTSNDYNRKNGLYVSSDDGASFSQVSSLINTWIYRIQQINNKIYIGTGSHGLYVSSDDGASFSQVSSLINTSVQTIQQINSKIYVGTGSKGLYVSSDDGASFSQVSSLINTWVCTIQQINNKIYIGTESAGLYISIDDGASFSQVSSLINTWVQTIQQINNKIYVGTGSNGLYVSSDGTNFSKLSSIPDVNVIKQINNKIYVGTDVGLFISSDGTSFTQVSSLQDNWINIIQQIGSKIYVGTDVGTDKGLYISSDGTSFTKVSSILHRINAIKQIGSKIYVGTEEDGLYVSTNNGKTFTRVESKNIKKNTQIDRFLILKTRVLLLSNGNVYWSNISDFEQGNINWKVSLGIFGITNSPTDTIQQIGSKIFVGTDGDLFISSDEGTSFTQVSSIPNDAYITTVQQIKDKIYVGADNGLYVSSDDGVSFTKVSSISSDSTINIIQDINNKIYVGLRSFTDNDDSIWVSSDDGTSFTKIISIPGNKAINIIQQIEDKIYFGILDNGLYVLSDDQKKFTKLKSIQSNATIKVIKQIKIGPSVKIYVGTNVGLYVSGDVIGSSFRKVSSINYAVIKVIQQIKDKIYVWADNGFYVSSDDGTSFIHENSFTIWVNLIQIKNNKIYFTTGDNSGFYYNFI